MQYYRTIERTFHAGDRPALKVANRRGNLVVVGEDREDIQFTAQLAVQADDEHAGNEQLDHIQLPMNEVDGRVEIGPPQFDEGGFHGVTLFGFRVPVGFGFGTRIDMQLRVPRACGVEALNRSGAIRVSGTRAAVKVEGRSGRIEVRDVEDDVHVESRSGGVEVHTVHGGVVVDSRSGKVEVEDVDGPLRLESRSGSIVARAVTGDVGVQVKSGRVRLETIGGAIEVAGGSGSVEVRGRVQRPISIELTAGAVRLAVSRDSAFYMDAESRVGSVRSELPVGYLERPPQDAPTVRVRTQSGAIRVVAL